MYIDSTGGAQMEERKKKPSPAPQMELAKAHPCKWVGGPQWDREGKPDRPGQQRQTDGGRTQNKRWTGKGQQGEIYPFKLTTKKDDR